MTWDEGIFGNHRNIAAYEGHCLRVRAGPGTGKTFALMRRIARLLEEGVPSNQILAVTFTKTAANDLVANLNSLNIPGADSVKASTLHSLAFSILNQRDVFDQTQRVPRPLLQYEIDCMISDLAKNFGGKRKVKELLLEFESFWATLQHLTPGWPQDATRARFQRELRSWMVAHECILIGELIPLVIEYIQHNPSAVHRFNYRHILVDEFQDLNKADQVFIDSLATQGNITIIGDENQSIYGFRFAHPEGIINFHSVHQDTHDEHLNECRRCPQLIVSMANSLISNNTLYVPPPLEPRPSNPRGDIYIVQHDTIQDETKNDADFIDWYLDQNPDIDLNDILILATRRKLGYAIRDNLLSLGRQAKSFFLEESLEKPHAQEGFIVLNLLTTPQDKAALRAWLGVDKQDKRSSQYLRIQNAANSEHISINLLLDKILEGSIPAPRSCQNIIARYSELKAKLSSYANQSGINLINFLWQENDPDCEEIRNLAISVLPSSTTINDLMEQLQLAITHPEILDDDNVIRIMSLHKSKGLTARCVIIAGCISGALPTLKQNLTAEIRRRAFEEQRRLFYVALTRTTKTLVISNAAMCSYSEAMNMGLTIRTARRSTAVLQSSPFLAELGRDAPPTLTGSEWRYHLAF